MRDEHGVNELPEHLRDAPVALALDGPLCGTFLVLPEDDCTRVSWDKIAVNDDFIYFGVTYAVTRYGDGYYLATLAQIKSIERQRRAKR